MSNRIDQKFKELRHRKKKAFIAFITAGDPDLKTTEKLVIAFERTGVDIMELGVPFSDPLADGPTIQASSSRSLRKNTTLKKILKTVKQIRKRFEIPIVLMTYYNPIFKFGEKAFVLAAKSSGVDGIIVPDLPPEEATVLIKAARKNNLSTIFFLSPTTTKSRMKRVIQASNGFIYYVSLTGVTGARRSLPKILVNGVKAAKRMTDKPICVGFGISKRAHIKAITKFSDGVIVGSAIISQIVKGKGNKNLISNVAKFVSRLIKC